MSDPSVFIIDDDLASAASLRALMESAGFQVELFRSAEDFLEADQGTRAGCLVLDIRLEGMSGLELQKSLVARADSLPVILISGHADEAIHREAKSYGAVAVLEKPFASGELCELVRQSMPGS